MSVLGVEAMTLIAARAPKSKGASGEEGFLGSIDVGLAILAFIGLAVGVVVLLVVVALFNRVLMPAREIARYADDILQGGIGISRGVDGLDELARTRELTASVPELANAYLGRLRGGQAQGGQP